MSDPLIHDCANYVILEPSKSEIIMSAKETKKWLVNWLKEFDQLPKDLEEQESINTAAQHLIDTACSLEIYPGFTVQWFAIRLEHPGN